MLCFREGAGPRGHLRRHHRAAGRRARGHGPARLPAARRRDPRTQRHAEPRRRHVGAGHRARSRGADAEADRAPTAATVRRPASLEGHVPGEARGARGLPEAGEPRHPRHRQQGRLAAVAARAPAPRGPASHQPGGRRHQLRDARARAAHARLRPGQAQGRPGRAAGEGRRKNHAARWQGNRAHDRCAGDRRRRRGRGHGGRHGWRAHRLHAPTPSTCCSKPPFSRRPPSPAAGAAMDW